MQLIILQVIDRFRDTRGCKPTLSFTLLHSATLSAIWLILSETLNILVTRIIIYQIWWQLNCQELMSYFSYVLKDILCSNALTGYQVHQKQVEIL